MSPDPLSAIQMPPCPHGCFAFAPGTLPVSKAHAEQLHEQLRKVEREFAAYRLAHP
jgi:hypothetical protein